jgi:hypothetical protein
VAGASPTELQRRIATEFERHGWEYDLTSGSDLVRALELDPAADPHALAERVSTEFLTRNKTTREAVAEAIERAVSGFSVERPSEAASVVINANDNRYSINLGPGASIAGSAVNVGGTQINVSVSVDKTEVLAAAEALIRAGLNGDWNSAAAQDLATVIDQRGDVTLDEIRELTTDIAKAEKLSKEHVRDFLAEVAANALGGALSVGISAGLGFIL